MMYSLKYFLVIAVTAAGGCLGQQFDRNFVGVAFSPYTDNLPGRYWDQYSLDDIKSNLRAIKTYFSDVSTYGMGTADYNKDKPWDKCDSNALIARAAAYVNTEGGPKLKVNIGVNQIPNNGLGQKREIDNAYAAAADANKISGGTVWGITFTNEYFREDERSKADDVLWMINQQKGRQGLLVGTRTHICGQIFDGKLKDLFVRFAKESDFIYCNVYASETHAKLGPTKAAEEVINYFFKLREAFQRVNPNLKVLIGETGWPSEGNSFNKSPNSIQNLRDYWNGISRFAARKGVKVQMFEAIDEPWKGQGEWKGESHYGWWKKPQNGNRQLIEKATNRKF